MYKPHPNFDISKHTPIKLLFADVNDPKLSKEADFSTLPLGEDMNERQRQFLELIQSRHSKAENKELTKLLEKIVGKLII